MILKQMMKPAKRFERFRNVMLKRLMSNPKKVIQWFLPEVFTGGSYTGKTMLARIIQQALIRLNYSISYESGFNLLMRLHKNEWHPSYDNKMVIVDYRKYSLLIIDDVTAGAGFSNFSGTEKQLLFAVIDDRFQSLRSTLLITNHTIDELTSKLGDPLVNRFLSKGVVLEFN